MDESLQLQIDTILHDLESGYLSDKSLAAIFATAQLRSHANSFQKNYPELFNKIIHGEQLSEEEHSLLQQKLVAFIRDERKIAEQKYTKEERDDQQIRKALQHNKERRAQLESENKTNAFTFSHTLVLNYRKNLALFYRQAGLDVKEAEQIANRVEEKTKNSIDKNPRTNTAETTLLIKNLFVEELKSNPIIVAQLQTHSTRIEDALKSPRQTTFEREIAVETQLQEQQSVQAQNNVVEQELIEAGKKQSQSSAKLTANSLALEAVAVAAVDLVPPDVNFEYYEKAVDTILETKEILHANNNLIAKPPASLTQLAPEEQTSVTRYAEKIARTANFLDGEGYVGTELPPGQIQPWLPIGNSSIRAVEQLTHDGLHAFLADAGLVNQVGIRSVPFIDSLRQMAITSSAAHPQGGAGILTSLGKGVGDVVTSVTSGPKDEAVYSYVLFSAGTISHSKEKLPWSHTLMNFRGVYTTEEQMMGYFIFSQNDRGSFNLINELKKADEKSSFIQEVKKLSEHSEFFKHLLEHPENTVDTIRKNRSPRQMFTMYLAGVFGDRGSRDFTRITGMRFLISSGKLQVIGKNLFSRATISVAGKFAGMAIPAGLSKLLGLATNIIPHKFALTVALGAINGVLSFISGGSVNMDKIKRWAVYAVLGVLLLIVFLFINIDQASLQTATSIGTGGAITGPGAPIDCVANPELCESCPECQWPVKCGCITVGPFAPGSPTHSGANAVDIGSISRCPGGTHVPVYATKKGIVQQSYGMGEAIGGITDYGRHIVMRVTEEGPFVGTNLVYGHLYDVNVQEGQEVAKGDLLGWTNNTGRSSGEHLHFEAVSDSPQISAILPVTVPSCDYLKCPSICWNTP